MKKTLVILGILIAAAALSAGGAIIWAKDQFAAAGPSVADTAVVVKRGQGVRQIAKSLMDAGVIEYDWLFAGMVRWRRQHGALAAGEYLFPAGVSPEGALARILANDTVVRSITIPEGLASRDVVALVSGMEGLEGEMGDDIPPEGSLLPETYHFSLGDSRPAMLKRMGQSMVQLKAALWPGRRKDLPLTSWEEAVTLASIVEKETGLAKERPHIASVFINRLKRGMRLQSDPTVRYALTNGESELGRPLTRKDWKIEHPYNTYVIKGLPPGPIANPGRAAIEAVLNPIDSRDLYFVADGSGGHAFARTLREHNRNVARWRKFKRQQQQN